MHIHNGINAVVVILKLAPVFDRAEIVAEGENAGGLNAAEYALFALRFLCLFFIFNVFHFNSSDMKTKRRNRSS